MSSTNTSRITDLNNWLGTDVDWKEAWWPIVKTRNITEALLTASLDTDEYTRLIIGYLFGQSISGSQNYPSESQNMTINGQAIDIRENIRVIEAWIKGHILWNPAHSFLRDTYTVDGMNLSPIGTRNDSGSLTEEEAQALINELQPVPLVGELVDNWEKEDYPGIDNYQVWGNLVEQSLMNVMSDSVNDLRVRSNVMTSLITKLFQYREYWTYDTRRHTIKPDSTAMTSGKLKRHARYALSKIRQNLYLCRVGVRWGYSHPIMSGVMYRPPYRKELATGWVYGAYSPTSKYRISATNWLYGMGSNLSYGDGLFVNQIKVETERGTPTPDDFVTIELIPGAYHPVLQALFQLLVAGTFTGWTYKNLRVCGSEINEIPDHPYPYSGTPGFQQQSVGFGMPGLGWVTPGEKWYSIKTHEELNPKTYLRNAVPFIFTSPAALSEDYVVV
jgi:hypothetical protein